MAHQADDVVAVGRPALAVAHTHDLDNPQVMLVRVNVAFSLLRGGRVAEADEVVGTPAEAPFEVDRWPLHTARAVIDSRRGLAGTAMARLEEIWAEPSTSAPRDLEFLVWASDVAWWRAQRSRPWPASYHPWPSWPVQRPYDCSPRPC